VTLRKRKDSGNVKRQHYIALCEELAMEEAMGMWGRLWNEWNGACRNVLMLPRWAAINIACDCECRRLDVVTQIVLCCRWDFQWFTLKMEAVFFSGTLVPRHQTAAHSIILMTSVWKGILHRVSAALISYIDFTKPTSTFWPYILYPCGVLYAAACHSPTPSLSFVPPCPPVTSVLGMVMFSSFLLCISF
jgi:hypothetical protein